MSYKVLMVDDEPLVLAGYRRILKQHFEVSSAASPHDALTVLKTEGPFAVILIDYSMPMMNGIDFVGEAAKIAPEAEKIMLTGKVDMQVLYQEEEGENICTFLTKPCSKEELVEAVRVAVRNYEKKLPLR